MLLGKEGRAHAGGEMKSNLPEWAQDLGKTNDSNILRLRAALSVAIEAMHKCKEENGYVIVDALDRIQKLGDSPRCFKCEGGVQKYHSVFCGKLGEK